MREASESLSSSCPTKPNTSSIPIDIPYKNTPIQENAASPITTSLYNEQRKQNCRLADQFEKFGDASLFNNRRPRSRSDKTNNIPTKTVIGFGGKLS